MIILQKYGFFQRPKAIMNGVTGSFSVLESTESSNIHAMAQLRAGLAITGDAWFAKEQTAGRGQRSKAWYSEPAQNILLSVAIEPGHVFRTRPFLLSMTTAMVCREFFAEKAGEEIKIKWPNDLYWRDRKTAGILIDNIFQGDKWQYAVVGIGMNINQTRFSDAAGNPACLKEITGISYDAEALARGLHLQLLAALHAAAPPVVIAEFNRHLYKLGESVKLKKNAATFETKIIRVNEYGDLMTADTIERKFAVGEVEWKH